MLGGDPDQSLVEFVNVLGVASLLCVLQALCGFFKPAKALNPMNKPECLEVNILRQRYKFNDYSHFCVYWLMELVVLDHV